MGKLATMVLQGSLKLGVPLLASLFFLQTGCLYLTTVYADFEPDMYNNHHTSQVTHSFYEPYLVSYDEDSSSNVRGDEDMIEGVEKVESDFEKMPHGDNAIIIQDFISLSSSKVLMKVKEGENSEEFISSMRDNVNNVNERRHDILHGYSSNDKTSDAYHSSVKEEDLKRLEKKFLSLFGMKNRPKRKNGAALGKRSVPKELLDLYEKQSKDDIHTTDLFLPGKLTGNANTVRVVHPFELSHSSGIPGMHAILKFDISSSTLPANEQITGAELRLPFSITIPAAKDSQMDITAPSVFARVLLHDIVKPQRRRPSKESLRSIVHGNVFSKPITHVIDSKLVNLTNRKYPNFWLTFDILPAVLRWMNTDANSNSNAGNEGNHTNIDSSNNNYGLALEIVGLKGEKHTDIKGGQVFNMKMKTNKDSCSLFIYSDDGINTKARSKRDANNKKSMQRKLRRATQHHYHHQQQYYRNHNQHHYHHYGRRRKPHRHKNRRRNLCSKKPMFVDFTDVGWNDWIVAPPGYQAYYCSGECPFPMAEHLNATNHAVIQALINSMNPSLVPPPCCVPNKYSSLSLLYTDSSDRIVLKNYNEMIVDSCGCS